MHIPVAGATVASAAALVAFWRSQEAFDIRRALILGLTTAFIFAAQTINFPVVGGTNGHEP